jgi:drug/metabolite transporter (DMT)-like permease
MYQEERPFSELTVQHSESHPSRSLVLAAYGAIYIIWGSTYLAIMYAVDTLPPFFMAGIRFCVAGAVIYAWTRWRGLEAPTRTEWWNATKVSLLLIVGGTSTVAWGEQWVPSGIAALLLATVPLWMILAEWVGPDRIRPSAWALVGVFLGLVGIAVLIGPELIAESEEIHFWGTIVILASAVVWVIGSLYARHVRLPASSAVSNGIEMFAGGTASILIGFLLGEHHQLHLERISTESIIALVYLITFGAIIAFSAYMWLLRVSSPSRVATHAYVNPVVAVLLGWVIANESVTPRTGIAMLIIVGAVVLITSTSRD